MPLASYEKGEVRNPDISIQPKDGDYQFSWTTRVDETSVPDLPRIRNDREQEPGTEDLRARRRAFYRACLSHGLYFAVSEVVHPDDIRFCVLHSPPEMDESRRAEIRSTYKEEAGGCASAAGIARRALIRG